MAGGAGALSFSEGRGGYGRDGRSFQRWLGGRPNTVRSGMVVLGSFERYGTPVRDSFKYGLLTRFVAMLIASRSFLSFPRHEYFGGCCARGRDMEKGWIPVSEMAAVGRMAEGVCCRNAKSYLELGCKLHGFCYPIYKLHPCFYEYEF